MKKEHKFLIVIGIIIFLMMIAGIVIHNNAKKELQVCLLDQRGHEISLSTSIYAGEKINIKVEGYSPQMSVRIWDKKEGEDWKVYTIEREKQIDYIFPDVSTISLQVDLLDENNNIIKAFWLGDFSLNEKPAYIYNNNTVIEKFKYSSNENYINQLLAVVILYIVGAIIVFPFTKKMGIGISVSISFFVGICSYVLCFMLLLVLKIEVSIITIAFLYILGVAVLYCRKRKEISTSRKIVMIYLGALLVHLLLSVVCIFNNWTIMGYDSYRHIIIGKNLATNGKVVPALEVSMTAYSIFVSVLHTIPTYFHFDFFFILQPVLSLTFLFASAVILYKEFVKRKIKKEYCYIFTGLFVLFLGSNFFWIFQSLWIMSNMITGMLLFFAIVFAKMEEEYKEKNIFWKLSLLMVISFAMCRVETPLQGFLVVAVISNLDIKTVYIKKYIISYCTFILFWYVGLMNIIEINQKSDFLSIEHMLPIVGIAICMFVYALLIDKKFFCSIRKRANVLIIMSITIILPFCADIDRIIYSIQNIIDNLLREGMWGNFWYIAIVILILHILLNGRIGYYGTLNYILIMSIIILGAMRSTPLRLGFGDSVNRMFMHIYPLVIYSIFIVIANEIALNKLKEGDK